MSNTIDNLLLNENTTATSVNSIVEQPNKDKPSLFDSLLSNISSSEEIKVDNSTTTLKSELKNIDVKNSEIQSDITVNNVESIEYIDLESVEVLKIDKEQKVVTTGSLLDKLVIEAKKSVEKVNDIGIKETIKTDNKIEKLKINNELEINTQEKDSIELVKDNVTTKSLSEEESSKVLNINNNEPAINDESIILDKNEIQNNEQKADKKSSSLLDRLIVEAKSSSKEIEKIVIDEETLKVENKNLTTLENIKSEDTKIDKNEELVVDYKMVDSLSKEVDSSENILPAITKKEDIKTALNDVAVDTNSKDEEVIVNLPLVQKVQEDSLKTSLFDKIISANIDNLDTTQSLNESIKTNTVDFKSTDVLVNNISNEVINNEEEKIEVKSEVVSIKKDEKLSLMDQLIQKNSEKLTLETTLNNNVIDSSLKEVITKDLISNIYLGSQKNKINNQTLFNKNEAMSILKDGNSIQAVKTSAEMLDLGLEDISVDQSIAVDKLDLKQLNKKGILENLLLQKNVKSEEIKNLITKSVEASKALIEDTITLANDVVVNVNSPISYNIQSRIIGAKQQMATMMSDISKQMYENYKPPVTAFKINLNPTELGSIAILMKSDKNSGLSITMNVSNNVTLDTLIENQNLLKNSLNKTFDESTKFNLDFSSSNQNGGNQSSSNSQNQSNRQFEQQMDTQAVLQLKEENKDIEEKVIDYM
jgi:hypothetical protein